MEAETKADVLGIPFWAVIVLMTLGIGIVLIFIGWVFMKLKYRKLLKSLETLDEAEETNPM